MSAYRSLPQASRQRGLPSIGFEVTPPDELEITPVTAGPALLRGCERRDDGRPVGELEVSVFAAALIIDRDGILEAKASEEAGAPAVAVSLPGASGYRAEAVGSAPLPYLYVFAVAPQNGIDGGVMVTLRCAHPDWPAAEAMLRSLRILTRHGTAPANDDAEAAPILPLVGASSSGDPQDS